MIECASCSSSNVVSNGGAFHTKEGIKTRHKCKDCGTAFSLLKDQVTRTPLPTRSLVITSVINDCDYDRGFFEALKTYTEIEDCELLIIPTRYQVSEAKMEYDLDLQEFLVQDNIEYLDYKLRILGALNLNSSLENPLSGLDPLTKGYTTVIGHPQVQLRTMPRVHDEYPPILTTTGSISKKPYKNTKPGSKAAFNHSLSAVLIEFDEVNGEKIIHLRHLNYDSKTLGFYDIDSHYTKDYKSTPAEGTAIALVTGDEHGIFADENVERATYHGPSSLVSVTMPSMLIRHDVFDCYSVSHHDKNDFLTRYQKKSKNRNVVEEELDDTIEYLKRTTPDFCKTYIIGSNHNEHLTKWLNECDPKKEPWNAKFYHLMMYLVLEGIDSKGVIPDPLEIYANKFKNLDDRSFTFLGRNDELKVMGITLSSHGDQGNNGSRGSRDQFALLPDKSIIGHTHSPGIEKGCYQVGTSSSLRLDYNKGASSWHHCHCLVHRNGKRQLIFITKGKFRK